METNVRGDEDPELWFREHYENAADQVLEFLGDDGGIEGKTVADVGCGDGIIDLALTIKGRPKKFVGYDVRTTDVDALLRSAAIAGVAETLPDALTFAPSSLDGLPAPDNFFDVVVTWSAFEHVSDPVRMLAEISRVLKPGGVLFLQLFPFFASEHGGHLWPHYDEPYPHLTHSAEAIREHIAGRRATDPTRDALDEWESLNRLTIDELQRAMLSAGLTPAKMDLITSPVHIPAALAHRPLSDLGIGGVKLLAIVRSDGA